MKQANRIKAAMQAGRRANGYNLAFPSPWVIDILGVLFKTAMQITNVGNHAAHDFTVSLQLEAQDPMRAGVLGTHVDDELVGIEKGFVSLSKFEMGDVFGSFGHWPLSIPRQV